MELGLALQALEYGFVVHYISLMIR
jgi:hypothetical protein